MNKDGFPRKVPIGERLKARSETAKVRHIVLPYIKGSVVDVGYGGDKIIPDAVGVDLPEPYTPVWIGEPIDVPCDVSKGVPLPDEAFDTVYCSHLVEDFEDTNAILKELLRMLKPGGRLVLVVPDQRQYEVHCRVVGQKTNTSHRISKMGLEYLKERLIEVLPDAKILFEDDCSIQYNVILIAGKPELIKENENI